MTGREGMHIHQQQKGKSIIENVIARAGSGHDRWREK
jgi:hypothetical protein